MSNLINEAAVGAKLSMVEEYLRGSNWIGDGSSEHRDVSVTQGGKFQEGGGEEEMQDAESIGEDVDVEGKETVVNQPSTRDPKSADWESLQKERWAPRNAFRKARKVAARQKQQQGAAETAMEVGHKAKVAKMTEEAAEKVKKPDEQGTAEKATAEKTVSSESQEMMYPPIETHSQDSRFLPSQQYQQGGLGGYTHLGRGEHPGAAYQNLCLAPDHLPDHSLIGMNTQYSQALSSPSGKPQLMPDYKSPYHTHSLPARPAPASSINMAGVSPAARLRYRKIEKAREKKFETFEQTVERVRGEERKKLEEDWKLLEEGREQLESQKKKLDEEWKKISREWKKMEKQRKKLE